MRKITSSIVLLQKWVASENRCNKPEKMLKGYQVESSVPTYSTIHSLTGVKNMRTIALKRLFISCSINITPTPHLKAFNTSLTVNCKADIPVNHLKCLVAWITSRRCKEYAVEISFERNSFSRENQMQSFWALDVWTVVFSQILFSRDVCF